MCFFVGLTLVHEHVNPFSLLFINVGSDGLTSVPCDWWAWTSSHSLDPSLLSSNFLWEVRKVTIEVSSKVCFSSQFGLSSGEEHFVLGRGLQYKIETDVWRCLLFLRRVVFSSELVRKLFSQALISICHFNFVNTPMHVKVVKSLYSCYNELLPL